MTIQLNPEQEQVIGRAIQAGLIANADDIVNVGIDAIRHRLQSPAESRTELETEQWLQEFRAWVHSHSTTTPLLSDEAISRDSIYGLRGL
jgi:proteasome lid subunit RPN8/RPN11